MDFVNNHFRDATEKVRVLFTGSDSRSPKDTNGIYVTGGHQSSVVCLIN